MSTTSRRGRTARPSMSVAARGQHDELVTLKVGPERRQYLLHRGFLVHYSQYFLREFGGVQREARERTISLGAVDPGIFNVFINFMYTRDLPCNEEWLPIAETSGDPNATETIDLLVVKAVIFGDDYLASDSKKAASSHLKSRLQERAPSFEAIIYAFNKLPAATPLLDHLVEAHCRSWAPDTESTSAEGQEARVASQEEDDASYQDAGSNSASDSSSASEAENESDLNNDAEEGSDNVSDSENVGHLPAVRMRVPARRRPELLDDY